MNTPATALFYIPKYAKTSGFVAIAQKFDSKVFDPTMQDLAAKL